jgi:hypothetical protein
MLNVIIVSGLSCNAQAMVLLEIATISMSELAGFVRFYCQARTCKANPSTLGIFWKRSRRRNANFLRIWNSVLIFLLCVVSVI